MDPVTREAISIIKGEMMGDEYLWDYEEQAEDGVTIYGIWKSAKEALEERHSGAIIGTHGRL